MYDASFKIIIFGDSIIERKVLTERFLTNLFVSDQTITIGVDFEVKSLTVDGQKVKLSIWDFGGEERFRFLLPTYVRGKQGGLFLYDVTNYSTIAHIDDWLSVIKKELPPGVKFPIIAVGLKSEFVEDREISVEEGIKIAESRGLDGHIVCNTKTGENIEELFEGLTKLMMQNRGFEASKKKINKASKKKINKEDKQRDNLFETKFMEGGMESVDTLDDLLKKLLGAIPEVKAAAIVSTEGLPIASALPQGIDETKFAAMIAALFSLSEKAINEMHKGEYDQLNIKGTSGNLLIQPAGPNAILAVLTTTKFKFNGEYYGFDRFPYPYIYNPPHPPDDIEPALQAQRKIPKEKEEPQTEHDCPYCGFKLPKGQNYCPICGKDVF